MTRTSFLVSSAIAAIATATSAATPTFSIPAGDLREALDTFARQSGVPIVASEALVAGRQSRAVRGPHAPGAALAELLAGSGLHAVLVAGAWVVTKDAEPVPNGSGATTDTAIVVTGTRIHGAGPIGTPVTVIDRDAIARSGRATVAEYLQNLPRNFAGGPNEANVGADAHNGAVLNQAYGSSINLRGLGAESTLVLIDGMRPALGGYEGSFVDTSLIPAIAIDRIEIVADGASAIYGTDAVAGVANIKMRSRLNGFETQLFSGTADGAANQVQFGQAAGKTWSSGGVFLSYEFDRRGRLPGSDRDFATEDLRRWGGPDLRSLYALPGTIIADDGSTFAVPAGQDGRNLSAGALTPGSENRFDRDKVIDLLPRQTTHSAYGSARQEIASGLEAFADLLWAHRAFDTVTSPVFLSEATVPTSNPFYVDPIGTGQPIGVDYDFGQEVGRPNQRGTVSSLNASAGLRYRVGSWTIEASGNWSRQHETSRETNLTSDTRIGLALADTNPATALNLLGDGSANNPATIAFIRAFDDLDSRYTLWSANLRADGTLLRLPAGPAKLAFGYEHRSESIVSTESYNLYGATPADVTTTPIFGSPGSRRVDAVYGELSVPVFGPDTHRLPGRLDLSLAGRLDHYSDVGTTTNPKIGVRWEPIAGLALRGSYGTSFRAPSFTENPGTAQNLSEPIYIPDPRSPTGQTAVLGLLGYAPGIKPERATTWTIGFDLQPPALSGFKAGMTYYDIAYRDRIGSANPEYAQFLEDRDIYGSLTQEPADPATVAQLYSSTRFANPFGIPASAIGAIIDVRTRNLSHTAMRGIDLDLSYAHPLLGGVGRLDFSGTRILSIEQRLTDDAPAVEMVGTIYNPTKLRARGTIGWDCGGFGASLTTNYVSGYRNTSVTPAEHVSSWTTLDGQIRYTLPKASPLGGATVALNVVNLLNRDPPFVEEVAFDRIQSYDPGQASPLGRVISVQLDLKW